MVYIGIQSGVYRHAIVAMCDSLEYVKAESRKAIEAEHDHYHNIEILTFTDKEVGVCELYWDKKNNVVKERPA